VIIAPTGSGRKEMKWISVKDRLPEEREKVIILRQLKIKITVR
jgi:hypothetical protein